MGSRRLPGCGRSARPGAARRARRGPRRPRHAPGTCAHGAHPTAGRLVLGRLGDVPRRGAAVGPRCRGRRLGRPRRPGALARWRSSAPAAQRLLVLAESTAAVPAWCRARLEVGPRSVRLHDATGRVHDIPRQAVTAPRALEQVRAAATARASGAADDADDDPSCPRLAGRTRGHPRTRPGRGRVGVAPDRSRRGPGHRTRGPDRVLRPRRRRPARAGGRHHRCREVGAADHPGAGPGAHAPARPPGDPAGRLQGWDGSGTRGRAPSRAGARHGPRCLARAPGPDVLAGGAAPTRGRAGRRRRPRPARARPRGPVDAAAPARRRRRAPRARRGRPGCLRGADQDRRAGPGARCAPGPGHPAAGGGGRCRPARERRPAGRAARDGPGRLDRRAGRPGRRPPGPGDPGPRVGASRDASAGAGPGRARRHDDRHDERHDARARPARAWSDLATAWSPAPPAGPPVDDLREAWLRSAAQAAAGRAHSAPLPLAPRPAGGGRGRRRPGGSRVRPRRRGPARGAAPGGRAVGPRRRTAPRPGRTAVGPHDDAGRRRAGGPRAGLVRACRRTAPPRGAPAAAG